MYYGNPSVQSESNGGGVFEFFDDFNKSTLDTNKWNVIGNGTISILNGKLILQSKIWETILIYSKDNFSKSDNVIVESKVDQHSTISGARSGMPLLYIKNDVIFGADNTDNTFSTYTSLIWSDGRNNKLVDDVISITSNNGDPTYIYENNIPDSESHIFGIIFSNSVAGFTLYSKSVGSVSSFPDTNMYVGLTTVQSPCCEGTNKIVVDWIRVRKYITIEPKVVVETSETKSMEWNINTQTPVTFVISFVPFNQNSYMNVYLMNNNEGYKFILNSTDLITLVLNELKYNRVPVNFPVINSLYTLIIRIDNNVTSEILLIGTINVLRDNPYTIFNKLVIDGKWKINSVKILQGKTRISLNTKVNIVNTVI